MKLLLKLIIVVILNSLGCIDAFAIDTASYQPKHIFKTNPFTLLMTEVNLSYEYRFERKKSFEITAGHQFGWSGSSNSDPIAMISEVWLNNANYLRLNYKYSPSKTLKNFYISPMIMLRERDHNAFVLIGESEQYREKLILLAAEGSFLVGYQGVREGIIFDLYLGVGLRYKSIFRHQYVRVTRYLGGTYYEPDRDLRTTELWPTPRLGLKIGFGKGKVVN